MYKKEIYIRMKLYSKWKEW